MITIAAVAALVATAVFVVARLGGGRTIASLADNSEYCTADAGGQVTLDLDQMANAATIGAVGIRRGVPERAVVIALAAALQESKLRNLSGGDRDSLGLFQQRPSQGWGTAREIADPRYAAARFYGALTRVRGWAAMTVTQAAQAVQRSALPEAYQRWEPDATVLARAFLADRSAAVACVMHGRPATSGTAALGKLTASLTREWGGMVKPLAASAPNVLALSVTGSRAGWQCAHWLVAHADRSGVVRVRYGGQEWTANAGKWAPAPVASVAATPSPQLSAVLAEVWASGR